MVKVTVKDGKVSQHFKFSEFFVNQTEDFELPIEQLFALYTLAKIDEEIRVKYNKPLKVTSGCRSVAYNQKCGGIKGSNHCWAIHADGRISNDLAIPFVSDAKAQEWIYFIDKLFLKYGVVGEVGIYDTFIHVGINIKYSNSNYNWRKKSGVQHNQYYKNKVK